MTSFVPENTQPNLPEIKFNIKKQDYRNLTSKEIDLLIANQNRAQDWATIFVSDNFHIVSVQNNFFSRTIYLGTNPSGSLEKDGNAFRTGIYNSQIESCSIGAHCAIHNVSFLSNYQVDEKYILQNIQQLRASLGSSFGCGNKNKMVIETGWRWLTKMVVGLCFLSRK